MASQGLTATVRRRTPKLLRRGVWRALQVVRREKPGLLMHYVRGSAAPGFVTHEGYEIRAWQPGDDAAWVELLNASGAFGAWDSARLESETAGLVREAQFFAVRDRTLIAATGILARPLRRRPALELAWVVRHPGHREKGLGRAVVVRTIEAAHTWAGERNLFLYTDDHRLTAIAIYLQLGFAPDLMSHRSYASRWESVFRQLAARGSAESSSADGRRGAPEPGPGE